MAITIVTRAGKGAPLNATEFDANLTNLAAAIENTSTGHDHDGTDSKALPISVTLGQMYAADSGSSDTYAITLSPVPAAYFDGMMVSFKANTANTGAATLNVNTLGAISITKYDDVALEDGDIEAGQVVTVVYNATGPKFEMLNPPAVTTGTGGIVRATSPTLVTPALGTPASGDLQNCTAATTTTKGVVELATVTEAVAGTSTSLVPTCDGVAAANAVLAREPDQGVAMTYAASGSSGITVADNDNIDFGTGNFTLVWKGSLPDWTPSITTHIFSKLPADGLYGYSFVVQTDGKLRISLYRNSPATNFESSVANTFTDGTTHEICAVITREKELVAGSVVLFVDGIQFGSSVPITAATTVTISNTDSYSINGFIPSHNRYASTTHHAYTFNRALTAAEVLDLYRNGIAFADKYGSQTALVINATDTMAADNTANWTAGGATVAFDTDHYELTSVGGGEGTLKCACSGLTIGKKYRWDIKIKNGTDSSIVCTPLIRNNADSATIATGTAGTTAAGFATVKVEWTATEANNLVKLSCAAMTDTNNIELDDSAVYAIGATLELSPEGIQPSPGQWLDASTNKLHAMQPATGSSLTRYKKDFEYRWTNTWTASSAAQYVGGLNQAVLSADHFITDIITQATETTDVENLTLGDGSDADRFVTAFTPSATRTKQTIAAQNDGTNLKLVYTPAAEATMTVETIIRGFIWEP